MPDKILVSNIQRFSIHDGPGIRTTVFLMGCPLSCPWCANPENLQMKPFISFHPNKCVAEEGTCFLRDDCPMCNWKSGDLLFLKESVGRCKAGAVTKNGQYYSAEELAIEAEKDQCFFGDCGGITLSGGEPLLQAPALESFVKIIREHGIHLCAESCLNVPKDNLLQLLPYIDKWFVDMKIVVPALYNSLLNGDLNLYLNNLDTLLSRCRDVTIRVPIVPGVTDTEDNLSAIETVLSSIRVFDVEIFSVHNLAESKYREMGKAFHHYEPASKEQLKLIQTRFAKTGQTVRICTL